MAKYSDRYIINSKYPTINSPHLHKERNLLYYFDEDLKQMLSVQSFESGFGINSASVRVGSYMRRFNGMIMTNKSAVARPYSIVVTELTCTVDTSAEGAFFDCYHYDMNGEDETLVGRLEFNEFDSQIGYAINKIKILIPAFRRVTIKSGGAVMRYPQGYYKYHEVIPL